VQVTNTHGAEPNCVATQERSSILWNPKVHYYNRTTATFNYENDLMFNLSIYFNQF
jgi:hypothetical protein